MNGRALYDSIHYDTKNITSVRISGNANIRGAKA